MRFPLIRRQPHRRAIRADAFKANDLKRVLGTELSPGLKSAGFKRLGSIGWVRAEGDVHHLIVVQCRQSGWDPRSGSQFIVELERSSQPLRGTGAGRRRIWELLDDQSRQEVLDFNSRVAQTLPPPDPRLVHQFTPAARDYYLAHFEPSTETTDSSDVWFAYYDETDAAVWANFIAQRLQPALEAFLARPSSMFG